MRKLRIAVVRRALLAVLMLGVVVSGLFTVGSTSIQIDSRFEPGVLDWRFQSGISEWPALVIYHNAQYRMIYDDNVVQTIYEQ